MHDNGPENEAALRGDDIPAREAVGRPSKRERRWRRRFGLATLTLVVFAAALALYELATWPDVAALARENPQTTAFLDLYRREAAKAGRKAEPEWRWVPYGAISGELKQAVLVSEDIDFFSHGGFAVGEIREAVRGAWEEGKPLRGASTLTQQLAKNLWLSPSRNPWRKVKEALLTFHLEHELSKRRILEIYLNVVEFGPGVYGAEAASRHFFGKSAHDLGRRESAALAAALPNPARWHPRAQGKTREKRIERIERRMAKAQWLKKEI